VGYAYEADDGVLIEWSTEAPEPFTAATIQCHERSARMLARYRLALSFLDDQDERIEVIKLATRPNGSPNARHGGHAGRHAPVRQISATPRYPINAAWIVFGNGELEGLLEPMAVLAWLDG
jgi:hypothetical protein